jgi:hypothetical protein
MTWKRVPKKKLATKRRRRRSSLHLVAHCRPPILDSFESVHKESNTRCASSSSSRRTAIANRIATFSMEFAKEEAVGKTLIVAQLWDVRELEVKAAADAGYPAWQAYWCWR